MDLLERASISGKGKQNRNENRKEKQNLSGNGGFDKLSDDELIRILSHMSLKEAARTSVLAHRWRYLWRFTNGTLRFDHRDTATGNVMEMGEFVSWVNTVVKLHQGRRIEGMVISVESISRSTCHAVDSWVYFATSKEVQRFELNPSVYSGYKFPSVEMLVSSHSLRFSSPFSRLRALRLISVDVKDEVVHYFLASCPSLEELCVRYSYVTKNIRIVDPPSLRVLDISRCLNIQSLEIFAVSLILLTFGGGENSLVLKSVPNLCELTISDDLCVSFVLEPKEHSSYLVQLEKLALHFPLLIRECNRPIVASPNFPLLCSLKRLEVQVYTAAGRSLLFFTSLIKASPQLREFRIEVTYSLYDIILKHQGMPFPDTNAAEAVKFVHRNLKVVEIKGYVGCSSEEELLLELIKIGPLIERVAIDTETYYYDEEEFDFCVALIREEEMKSGKRFLDIGATTRDEAKGRARHFVSKFPKQIEAIVT